MPQDETKDSGVPLNTLAFLDYLDKIVPTGIASVQELATEEGRLRLAYDVGQRELVDTQKLKLENGGQ